MTAQDNLIYLSPKFEFHRLGLESFLLSNGIRDHVVFLSSGTTSLEPKGYAFTPQALFANAIAVNKHLGLNFNDKWGLTLPQFHVGGISILFRSSLLGHEPINLFPWNPQEICQQILEHNLNFISLVPTQLYDLVKLQLKCPPGLKHVLIGGDFLSVALEERALELGWPILRTFGMSELGSQIATSVSPSSQNLKILNIHELKTDEDQRLWIKSSSLFSFELKFENGWKMKSSTELMDSDGFYPLPDRGNIDDGFLTPLGRHDGKIKSSGRLIDPTALKEKLDSFMLKHEIWGKMDLSTQFEERKGQILLLEVDKSIDEKIIQEFRDSILPIKIDQLKLVDELLRNELGKKIKSHPSSSND
jgi:o-succinylbenzoate---CoA ligase